MKEPPKRGREALLIRRKMRTHSGNQKRDIDERKILSHGEKGGFTREGGNMF